MSYHFATRTAGLRSSAIRDLLKVTEMSDMLSLAGGLPKPSSWHPGSTSKVYLRRVERIAGRIERAAWLRGEI